jgi:two-component system, sensor histidine kinase PdtaS
MFTAASPRHESATKLMLAMVESSNSPLLLLDGDMVIVAASTSFCIGFHIDPARVQGCIVFDLGAGEWNSPKLRSLLGATLSGSAQIDKYEMDLRATGRKTLCLLLNAQKLAYGDEDGARITLAIADVTEAREIEKQKDDLLRDKIILLQEIQHRVANSLQIIASVLMMSARKVQSEETRGHLHDAHNRVMSIAALQQQLTTSTLGDVKLRAYFTQLCQSLGASMIHDPRQLSLKVDVDESSVSADTSVSLGLIVTELVINALKHAFPGGRIGKIVVNYRSNGDAWTLFVSDNGVGMPAAADGVKPGLGTSIVAALAAKLEGEVQTSDAKPGTRVSIVQA